MARFFPDLHSKNLKLTLGERRFSTALYRNLEDDYCCWVNVPVGRKQLRPDFVVLHPGRGVLVLEVKDWKLPTIQCMDRFSAQLLSERGLVAVANPLEQARNYALEITRLLECDPLLVQQEGRYKGHLMLPWGFGAVLTNISRKQFMDAGLDGAIPPDKVICQDEMTESVGAEAFQEKLWAMFHYSFGGVLSLARIDRIRWHLYPEIRVNQGNLFDPVEETPDTQENISRMLPDIIKVMDQQQEKVARNLGEGHRIIHGVAGSGKTLLLAYRCLHLDQSGLHKPVLVLCFNKTLAAELKTLLTTRGVSDKVQIRHFHGWCKDMCDLYQLDLPEGDAPRFEKQVLAVIEGAKNGRVPRAQYAAVLIDEGHDFEPDWFRLLVQMIDPESNSLLLLYDDAQTIYGKSRRRSSWASVGIEAKGRSTILKVNYRNTVEALDFSYHFLSAYVDEKNVNEETPLIHPERAGRHGIRPEVKRFASAGLENDFILEWIKKRLDEGLPYREIALLCRSNKQANDYCAQLKKSDLPVQAENAPIDAVRVLTIHSSKGLEFNSVLIPNLGAMPRKQSSPEEEARLLYVALTRSTERLVVTYHNESEFTKRCEELCPKEAKTF